MLIHSIIGLSDIFFNTGEPRPKPEYKRVNGGLLEIESFPGGKRIRRLISTDPALYLNKKYMPYTDCSRLK